MKRWHSLLPNWAIVVMLAVIVTFNLVSSYYGLSLMTKATTLAIIPLLLVTYFYRQSVMANIFLVMFILCFLGTIFNTFDHIGLMSKLSESCFLGAYALVIFVMMGKLKHVKFEGLVSMYLILILLVNTYLMYSMFSLVKDSFMDSVILTLTVSRGIALLIMGFLAFAIYLSKESSQSILYLSIVCCFVFSDVLNFITSMYIHFWLFEGFQNILQAVGLLLFCVYVYNSQEVANSFRNSKSEIISRPNPMTVRS